MYSGCIKPISTLFILHIRLLGLQAFGDGQGDDSVAVLVGQSMDSVSQPFIVTAFADSKKMRATTGDCCS